jgi:uncharacterized membrane protein YoaK (UPF0700 family)
MSAISQPYRLLLPAALLCIAAGYVDAIGYLALGHVFASNMTGNTVLLAIAAAEGELHLALTYVLTLAAFFLGAIAAVIVKRASGLVYMPLLLAAALLVSAPVTAAWQLAPLLLLATAMGLQGGSISTFGRTNLQTVVITSTLMKLAEGLVDWLWRTARRDGKTADSGTLPLFATAWLSYALGAGMGALAIDRIRYVFLVPALLLLLAALELAVARPREK